MGFELVALLFTTVFTGICVYVAVVEHLARTGISLAALAILVAHFATKVI